MSKNSEDQEKDYSTTFDREFHSSLGKYFPLSPASLGGAYFDWMTHLAMSPGKQTELWESGLNKGSRLVAYALCQTLGVKKEKCTVSLASDRRFQDESWQTWPFNIYEQTFLLTDQWWNEATSSVQGVSQHHSSMLPFLTRQTLDMVSPLNFPMTNPQVVQATIHFKGMNLAHGISNILEDTNRKLRKEPPAGIGRFKVGKNLAVTKGKVIFQNRLIELIQYSPTTENVYAEPVLITPAWIMKYYILDLSPHNSLVKYLVDNNHTVFMISWKNPSSDDRDLGFEEYIRLGIMDALDAVSSIIPNTKIHSVGYCLGGTLLSMAAAAMARDGDDRLKTVTLFASQVDFEDAGELLLFIDESEITFLENLMWKKGYLDSSRMAGTFNMLRSYDLIWSKMIERYLLGRKLVFSDLMAWNEDTTRMPYKMHSQYLRDLFLNNILTSGKFMVKEEPIALNDITVPIFSVGTQKDHISPWKSVFKIHLFVDSDITFILTSGGHNAGIVSEPNHPHRSYQLSTHTKKDLHPFPDEWFKKHRSHKGSWWPAWVKWLKSHSSGKKKPPQMGAPQKGYTILRNSPGLYVMEK